MPVKNFLKAIDAWQQSLSIWRFHGRLKLEWMEPEAQNFAQAFREAQEQFKSGVVRKLVPVVFSEARLESTSKTTTEPTLYHKSIWLKNGLKTPSHLTIYGEWGEAGGFLGASPELLFQRRGRVLETMAIAGTRAKPKKNSDLAKVTQDFIEDHKERDEHQIVVDDICSVLRRYGRVETAGPRVLELPKLLHLKTDIKVQLRSDVRSEELIAVLHPTPALGCAPRSQLHRLREMDRLTLGAETREQFGAPFGWVSSDSALLVVAIRSLQWRDGLLRIGSGCGLVSESQVDREWEELAAKRRSVRQFWGLES